MVRLLNGRSNRSWVVYAKQPLQRRIRACLFGVRAEMPPPGATELTDLELFLAWRAQGLLLESPGVRR